MFLTATQVSSTLGVSSGTLHRWHRKGKIAAVRSPGGVYVYARVSSSKQKTDLEQQQEFLLTKCSQHKLVSDIGSGINFKRPGLHHTGTSKSQNGCRGYGCSQGQTMLIHI
ncbi:3722_t:CDS:2 [Cetraspora pellucida]|uniref:3722_t:CDS:1 n=1 Tax=Cetraspora pellucida TaxID=1433469 RepID=A0ACA9LDI0_9GLOM|nr:3722_t:CDS:2 [Cetraspora pellucida]